MSSDQGSSNTLVLTLFFLWVLLILLLFYLYKRLNRATNNQYTIQRFVYGQGGLQDRVRQGVDVVTRLTANLRPQNHDEEEAMGDDEDENREEDNDGENNCHDETNREEDEGESKDDSSDDYSSIDLRERVNQNNSSEEKKEKEQKEESKDADKEEEPKQELELKDEERVGLLVNIKPFSGSANWSEEKTEESNVTAL